jgi:hypothetical protein
MGTHLKLTASDGHKFDACAASTTFAGSDN